MMSKEKELLLALLVEKYSQPKQATTDPVKTVKRRRRGAAHKWTTFEKVTLYQMKQEGSSWQQIADRLNLRPAQCRSMFGNLPMNGGWNE